MKHAKKLLALVLALSMAITLALPAFAADGDVTLEEGGKQTIEINGQKIDLPTAPTGATHTETLDDHSFNVYEIFDAEYAEEKQADGTVTKTQELVAIKWGAGVNAEALFNALKGNAYVETYNRLAADKGEAAIEANPFANVGVYAANDANLKVNQSAYAVAKVLADFGTEDSTAARAFAILAEQNKAATVEGSPVAYGGTLNLEPGYYLVVDATTLTGDDGAKNLSIVSMATTGAFTPKSKVDVPELEKKVLEVNDSEGREDPNNYAWSDTADYDVNDTVPFVLTGTLPTNYESYEKYYYSISDTMSGGLKLNADSIRVLVNGKDAAEANYTKTVTENGFTITFADLKQEIPVANGTADRVQVVYTATLGTEGLVFGGTGNPNTAQLKFSNDPNVTGEGEPPTGTTPEDKVTVFTFKLTFDKVDDHEEPLPGAGFTLSKFDAKTGEYVTVGTEIKVDELNADGEAVFNFDGLDAGKYKLEETTVPNGYNKAEDMYFTITATFSETEPYSVTSLTVEKVTDAAGNVIANTDGDALVTINGVAATGTLDTAIMNLKGVLLPETGGIGTTIFYVVGGLLIIGAGVVLITKKRLKNAE